MKVRHEGKVYKFPDSVTPEEAQAFLMEQGII